MILTIAANAVIIVAIKLIEVNCFFWTAIHQRSSFLPTRAAKTGTGVDAATRLGNDRPLLVDLPEQSDPTRSILRCLDADQSWRKKSDVSYFY